MIVQAKTTHLCQQPTYHTECENLITVNSLIVAVSLTEAAPLILESGLP